MGRLTHKHHIIPRYEGGSDEPDNLVELSPIQHAMWHFAEWQRKGNWQDELAWKGLVDKIGKEELSLRLSAEGGKAFKGPCPARKEAWARLREDPERYEEVKRNMREGRARIHGPAKPKKPKYQTEGSRKQAKTMTGRKLPDEVKRRISEGMKAAHARRKAGKN